MEILGIPFWQPGFLFLFHLQKTLKGKDPFVILLHLEEVGIVNPHIALILLRLCEAFCKLVHLARGTPSTLASKAFGLINDDIQMTFCQCIGVDMSDADLGFGHCPTTQQQHSSPPNAHLALVCIHLTICLKQLSSLTAWSHLQMQSALNLPSFR